MNETTPGVDPKRIVAMFYVVAAVVVGIFLERAIDLVLSYARVSPPALLGEDWTLATLIGFGVAGGLALFAWNNERTRGVSLEVATELKKVTWPSMRETRAATVAVVVATFIAAVILGLFDFVWARLSALIY